MGFLQSGCSGAGNLFLSGGRLRCDAFFTPLSASFDWRRERWHEIAIVGQNVALCSAARVAGALRGHLVQLYRRGKSLEKQIGEDLNMMVLSETSQLEA